MIRFWVGLQLAGASLAAQLAPDAGQRLDIGGRTLWISCTGAGRPVVVLEAGHNQPSATWAAVQPGIAAFTRVCSYDRAGLGRSDRSLSFERQSREIVGDLLALLDAAGETGPFVLVGHSLGGALVRIFAASHPGRVAGLVLVDAVHEREFAAVEELLTPEQRTAGRSTRPLSPEGIDLEGVLADLAATRSRLLLPLVVVARGLPLSDAEMPSSWSAEQRQRREALRLSLQADLASLSPAGRLVFARRSGHFVQRDEPELVVEAIRNVVELVRGR